jgi:hypothetical protein
MRPISRFFYFYALVAIAAIALAGCAAADNSNSNTTATTTASPPPVAASPTTQTLTVVERPQKTKDMMAARGEQDQAKPTLSFVSPKNGQTLTSTVVPLKLNLGGALMGYKPMKDPTTGMGNHVHVILDNQPYEAYYDLSQPFEMRNVGPGKHTLRVFPSRPWHESYKNDGAFQIIVFTVKSDTFDPTKPTTSNTGQVMSNANTPPPSASPSPAKEGKEMALTKSTDDFDPKKPLLTYSRPKGEYKGADADAIMIDFWLTNVKLQGDGGEYRVRYSIDGGEARFIEKWEPIWLSGWTTGKHMVKMELVDKAGNLVDNGGYNSTSREITVTR